MTLFFITVLFGDPDIFSTVDADNVFDDLIPDHNRKTYSQFQQVKWTHTLSGEEEFYFQFYHNQNKHIDDYVSEPIAARVDAYFEEYEAKQRTKSNGRRA